MAFIHLVFSAFSVKNEPINRIEIRQFVNIRISGVAQNYSYEPFSSEPFSSETEYTG